MKKKIIIPLLIIGIFVLVGGGVFVWNKNKERTSQVAVTPSPTPTPEPMETWDDPAGFSFKYPKGIVIDKHDEDKENYAHIEMTKSDTPGTIMIWAKDTNAASLDAWIKSDKTLKQASSIDTTLGGLEGKKIMLKEPQEKLITGTITDAILFTVEAEPKESDFWKSTYTTIVESFTFGSDTKKSSEGAATSEDSGGGFADEEEVLE